MADNIKSTGNQSSVKPTDGNSKPQVVSPKKDEASVRLEKIEEMRRKVENFNVAYRLPSWQRAKKHEGEMPAVNYPPNNNPDNKCGADMEYYGQLYNKYKDIPEGTEVNEVFKGRYDMEMPVKIRKFKAHSNAENTDLLNLEISISTQGQFSGTQNQRKIVYTVPNKFEGKLNMDIQDFQYSSDGTKRIVTGIETYPDEPSRQSRITKQIETII